MQYFNDMKPQNTFSLANSLATGQAIQIWQRLQDSHTLPRGTSWEEGWTKSQHSDTTVLVDGDMIAAYWHVMLSFPYGEREHFLEYYEEKEYSLDGVAGVIVYPRNPTRGWMYAPELLKALRGLKVKIQDGLITISPEERDKLKARLSVWSLLAENGEEARRLAGHTDRALAAQGFSYQEAQQLKAMMA